jgi:hypothetical protein
MVYLSVSVNVNKKSNVPGAWFTRYDVQNVSALFSGGHWYEVSL